MSTAANIRSIMRRATRGNILNILVIGCTHERYETTLCKTGHNFYVYKLEKDWNTSYGKIPDNYIFIDHIPNYIDFDLILVHATDDRIGIAVQMGSIFNVPIIRQTHTVPSSVQEVEAHNETHSYVNCDSFISEFSKFAWGYDNSNSEHINHGIDVDFWGSGPEVERLPHCLSVVNLWPSRDWACGWNLYNNIRRDDLPVRIVGDNPGLSRPASGIEDLRSEYRSSLVFLNTSINSPVPMSLLEAMASGCAIVSTKTCMIPEIILDGWNGYISNEEDVLRDRCSLLLNNKDLASILGKEAQKTIKDQYSLESFINNWNQLFRKVIYR